MNLEDKTLVRKLAWVLVIKLLALMALWWFFAHDQPVAVNGDGVATQLLGASITNSKE